MAISMVIWVSAIMSAENRKQLYFPRGFRHICISLVEHTEGQHKIDALYESALDRAIEWGDAESAIQWPLVDAVVSLKGVAAHILAFVCEL